MDETDMKARTKGFSLRVIKLVEALPRTRAGDILGRQLLRAGTSVGANYRAVRRARSTPDFINKLGVVEEEADESAFWLELIKESGMLPESRLNDLLREAEEITKIIVASIQTAKRKR